MANAMIAFALAFLVIAKVKTEPISNYKHANSGSSFGELLKPPPPPPPLSNIIPVPFHGGGTRNQRQNVDIAYQYPPPPPPPPVPQSDRFKFPAPFYRQYNFNFVPPPQPFTTTPSPSMFQKVSNWLFPSDQTQHSQGVVNGGAPTKKDCNPCNLVPWVPVIRYDLSGKKLQQNSFPTYGPPSPTAVSNNIPAQFSYPDKNVNHFQSLNLNQNYPQFGGIPHTYYGPPNSYLPPPSSTYAPPSPTAITIPSNSPSTSTNNVSSAYGIPSSSYGIPSSSYGVSSSSYGVPSSYYGVPSSSYGVPSSSYGAASSTFNIQSSTYGTPTPPHEIISPDKVYKESGTVAPNYNTIQNTDELKLPKVSHPQGFKNSYGETITSSYLVDIPYPASATAAESTKIKTEILPNSAKEIAINDTFTVAKPAPFSINKGRNIHTLQPVALPNLSVSPLPPIFNARPFRSNTKIYLNNLKGINNLLQKTKNVDIAESVPLAEFAHSIDYPATVIQAPIIDLTKEYNNFNQSKGYRNIPNSYSEDYSHDISSQASEDHVAATKTNQEIKESSFESTGVEYDNELYDHKMPLYFRYHKDANSVPPNHKPHFTDLRGVPDDQVDKFRTEGNLQSVDSPLLYLKPSAPHKDFDNFVTPLNQPLLNSNDYEIYDDVSTTISPEVTTSSFWHNSKVTDFTEDLSPPPIPQEERKPKVVQIVIPYTTSNNDLPNVDETGSQEWISASADESQGRKVPSQTIDYSTFNTATESEYITTTTITNSLEETQTVTEATDTASYNTHAILNDLYDVKEPPFDVIKLQQNIDDWTEQEYSKHHRNPQKLRSNGKYAHAKQIPDEYFTTPNPTITTSELYNYNYNYYDYEGSSSVQHPVRDELNHTSSTPGPPNHHNYIEIHRDKAIKEKKHSDSLRPYIYTAASAFRSTSTTPAPWEKIETSISPLTKEKVYVVTSKPWRDNLNITTWYSGAPFESKKTTRPDNDVSASDNLPFKSPRFLNRPPIPASNPDSLESLKTDSSYRFSKSLYQSINELESGVGASNNTTSLLDRSDGVEISLQSKMDEGITETTTGVNREFTGTDLFISTME